MMSIFPLLFLYCAFFTFNRTRFLPAVWAGSRGSSVSSSHPHPCLTVALLSIDGEAATVNNRVLFTLVGSAFPQCQQKFTLGCGGLCCLLCKSRHSISMDVFRLLMQSQNGLSCKHMCNQVKSFSLSKTSPYFSHLHLFLHSLTQKEISLNKINNGTAAAPPPPVVVPASVSASSILPSPDSRINHFFSSYSIHHPVCQHTCTVTLKMSRNMSGRLRLKYRRIKQQLYFVHTENKDFFGPGQAGPQGPVPSQARTVQFGKVPSFFCPSLSVILDQPHGVWTGARPSVCSAVRGCTLSVFQYVFVCVLQQTPRLRTIQFSYCKETYIYIYIFRTVQPVWPCCFCSK